ncbi:MAG: cobalt-precorrin-6A reductase, partial [Aestuariivirga sp.]|nr:cobalt-precorrin-6A reductase [Aestuariivirga sp.]
MPADRILILGGTREARELASLLTAEGRSVVTSLAGVTRTPALPPGEVRTGGFGGAGGLLSYLRREAIALVVDATHPFAARMSANAHEASAAAGVPLLRLERPPWQPGPGDRWTPAETVAAAAAALPPGARVLLTIGRKEVAPFFAKGDLGGIARMIEETAEPLPPNWSLLMERPPFSVAYERKLLVDNALAWLVTKNAGGGETEAKLVAARELGLPVIMVARPPKPRAVIQASAGEMAVAIRRLLS